MFYEFNLIQPQCVYVCKYMFIVVLLPMKVFGCNIIDLPISTAITSTLSFRQTLKSRTQPETEDRVLEQQHQNRLNSHHYLKLRLGNDERVSILQRLDAICNKLVDNLLCRLLVVDNSSDLAHEERPCVIHSVVINVVTHLLQVVLDGYYALASELLDLVLPVFFPVVDVWVVADAERTAGKDDCADVVVPAGGADGFLVDLWCAGLLAEDEARSDPHTGGAECEHGGERFAAEDTASSDDLDLLAGQGRLVALDHLDGRWDEDGCGGVASVSSTLASLCADDVDADVEALLDVLGVSDHVHVQNTGLVELLDYVLGGHTDGGNEELCARLNDDIDELVQLALCVVVAVADQFMASRGTSDGKDSLGLASVSSDLRKKKVNTKRRALVLQVSLELGDLLAKHVRCVSKTTNDTETSGICDGGSELGSSSHVHTGKYDGVLDLKQIGELGTDLL